MRHLFLIPVALAVVVMAIGVHDKDPWKIMIAAFFFCWFLWSWEDSK